MHMYWFFVENILAESHNLLFVFWSVNGYTALNYVTTPSKGPPMGGSKYFQEIQYIPVSFLYRICFYSVE